MSEVDGKPLVWALVDEAPPIRRPLTSEELALAAEVFGDDDAQRLARVYGVEPEEAPKPTSAA